MPSEAVQTPALHGASRARPSATGGPFFARWGVTGSLTTTGPLAIHGGGTTTRKNIDERLPDGSKRLVDIAAVAVDRRDRAYIPGTTLKGSLRAWLVRAGITGPDLISVFGSAPPVGASRGVPGLTGGGAEFRDAFAADDPFCTRATEEKLAETAPGWCPTRLTGVATSVSIDRRRRTAVPQRLFHTEFVPAGVVFDVTVTGEVLATEARDGQTRLERDIALAMIALEGFDDDVDPVTLGAEWGNGFGRMTWTIPAGPGGTGVSLLMWNQVEQWLTNSRNVGYGGMNALDVGDPVWQSIAHARTSYRASRRAAVSIGVSLQLDGPFLINDPTRAKPRTERDSADKADDPAPTGSGRTSPYDHVPLIDDRGCAYLPARSLRGALRSQAERILRTLAGDEPRIACAPNGRDACLAIAEASRADTLCLACHVFGAGGWRSTVELSSFVQPPEVSAPDRLPVQHFVAVDRFTGGAAEHLKFDAEYAYRPTLSGRLSVDLSRVEAWGLGLLLLTLRDVLEGDVPMGFGRAKGYGSLFGDVTWVATHRLGDFLAREHLPAPVADVARTACSVAALKQNPLADVERVLSAVVGALHDKIRRRKEENAERIAEVTV